MADEKSALEHKLVTRMTRTIHTHALLREGDRVMVCMSGGKDSYTMLHGLTRVCRSLPFRVELIAEHLDQQQVALASAARPKPEATLTPKPQRFGALPVHSNVGLG